MDIYAAIAALAGLATTTVAFLIAGQLQLAKQQEIRSFILGYNARYDRIVARIPLRILVENCGTEAESGPHRPDLERSFFDYFSLCEEQLGLWQERWNVEWCGDPERAAVISVRRGLLDQLSGEQDIWVKTMTEWTKGMEENCRLQEFVKQLNQFGCGLPDTPRFRRLGKFLVERGVLSGQHNSELPRS